MLWHKDKIQAGLERCQEKYVWFIFFLNCSKTTAGLAVAAAFSTTAGFVQIVVSIFQKVTKCQRFLCKMYDGSIFNDHGAPYWGLMSNRLKRNLISVIKSYILHKVKLMQCCQSIMKLWTLRPDLKNILFWWLIWLNRLAMYLVSNLMNTIVTSFAPDRIYFTGYGPNSPPQKTSLSTKLPDINWFSFYP